MLAKIWLAIVILNLFLILGTGLKPKELDNIMEFHTIKKIYGDKIAPGLLKVRTFQNKFGVIRLYDENKVEILEMDNFIETNSEGFEIK